MEETLLLADRVRNTIRLGEGQFREFKSALEGSPSAKQARKISKISADIAEALVGFANAEGGELLVGVEDNGDVTGVPHSQDEVLSMLKSPEAHLQGSAQLPMIAATELMLEGKRVLFFSVAKGSTQLFQLTDGRCMRRIENATMPADANQLLFDRQEIRSREYDRNFVDGASVTDLNINLISSIADNYLRGLSAERYLQQVGLAEYAPGGLRLRMAALLLFAQNIAHWHPRSQVRILKVVGTELKSGAEYNVQSDEVVSGNILDLLVRSWEALRPFLAYKTEFGAGGFFEQKYLYPELACREALVNAIAHRDYSVQNGIDVFIFDNRMEFRNPGALLSTLSVADLEGLQGAHESRNSLVAKVLRENKFMRELGEGVKRMFELMVANELQHPQIQSDGTAFHIILPHRSVFSTLQEQWLMLFQQFELSTIQKKILVLGMNDREVSQSDIFKAINTTDRNIYDPEVSGLRKNHSLIEIRTNAQSSQYARRKRIAKAEVPRFRVQLPQITAISHMVTGVGSVAVAAISDTKVRKRTTHDPKRTLYLSGFPYDVKKDEIDALFGADLKPSAIDLPRGVNKGFAFVEFSDESMSTRALVHIRDAVLGPHKVIARRYRSE